MQGFFKQSEITKTIKSKSAKKQGCEACKLKDGCQSPKMKVTGLGDSKILFVAEAPGKKEDETGIQLIGQAGQILRRTLMQFDFVLDKEAWKTNAILCRPPKNRTPTTREISLCRENLFKTIEELKPEKIILLGRTALLSFLGHRMKKAGAISKWVGWGIPDQKHKCWIFPTYHPSYLLRDEKNKALWDKFTDHIYQAITWHEDLPETVPEVEIIKTSFAADIFLEGLRKNPEPIVIDIETTGKKPYRKGHEIICISICTKSKAYSFPIFDDPSFLKSLRRVLQNKRIKKTAHNIQFEDTWIKTILGYSVLGWDWDTMIEAHIHDNRMGVTGLKFQTYVNFGILGYDDSISKFLESKSKNSNDFNTVKEAPLNELLQYCGEDAYYTQLLQQKQKSIQDKNEFFHNGTLALAKVSQNGIHVDSDFYLKMDKRLQKKIGFKLIKITESTEAKKLDREFNPDSSKDMKELLFDILEYESAKKTAGGNDSTDQEALESIGTDFTKDIVAFKKLRTIKNTFLAQFIREATEGHLHPNYNLNTVQTYRSSSNAPNFQNIPKRDEYAQKVTRTGVIPRPGRMLMEVDYSGIEVCISACYHKDPAMIKYITDPSTDMHRDTAMELFMMKKDHVNKENRYLAKNNFVFPQFYGDWYQSCAQNLWAKIDKETKEHLKSRGIKTYIKYEKHVQKVEGRFWNERFFVYSQWKKDTWNDYQKTGHIKSLTGFRCGGLMKKNDALNYPIQGSAFHCLLWSLCQLQDHIKHLKYDSLIIGQIHDSIIFDIVPDELEDLKILIRRVMCEDIKEYWKWLIVPLDIDAEISEIDGDWNNMKEEEI